MLRKTILNTISIDIVEMIVVFSKDYKLFKTLRLFLIKLHENNRTVRIKDKLTICENKEYGYTYFLNNKCHREYDKPSIIDDVSTVWYKNGKYNRINNNPDEIYNYKSYTYYMDDDHSRVWHYVRINKYPNCIESIGNMQWFENDLPYEHIKSLYFTGHQYDYKADVFMKDVFTYI